jgi:predicted dehydrogenase
MAEKHRIITSQPRAGEKITVKTPTNIQALLEFASGATVTLLASWDVWANRQPHMDLYGTEGSLYLPDPNFFGGTVLASKRGSKPEPLPEWKHPFGVNNQKDHNGDGIANYRALGLADLADAIMKRRDPRCSLDRALHAVEIMTAILKSGETGRFVTLKTRCTRAAPLTPEDAQALLA